MRLIIAEKPSVGRNIVEALGKPGKRTKSYVEIAGQEFVVSWCFGHLYELLEPDEYTPEWGGWPRRLDVLPMVPEEFVYRAKPKVGDQIKALRGLLRDAREVIHAGDFDNEGQAIVDRLLQECRYKGPVKRLVARDQSVPGIREALRQLEDNKKYHGMRLAAEARAAADWIVGMNYSRLCTTTAEQREGKEAGKRNHGRLMTPTLYLVVLRDRERENFKAVDFFDIKGRFEACGVVYEGYWVIPETELDPNGLLIDSAKAQAMLQLIKGGGTWVVGSAKHQEQKISAPLPFTMNDLPGACDEKFDLGANETLQIAQALYEEHKLTSYPRTDCAYIGESSYAKADQILNTLEQYKPEWQRLTRMRREGRPRCYDDKKIAQAESSHTGIIPTGEKPGPGLSIKERQVFDLIAERYIAQFLPDEVRVKSEVLTEGVVGGKTSVQLTFRSSASVQLEPGWKAVLQVAEEEDEEAPKKGREGSVDLRAIQTKAPATNTGVKLESEKTKKPPAYTTKTLMAAMIGVARFVSDPQIKAILREKDGIGTPTTRPPAIDKLIKTGYIEKKGRALTSTPLGRAVVDQRECDPKLLDPGTTALWELYLKAIEQGKATKEQFIGDVAAQVRQTIERAKSARP